MLCNKPMCDCQADIAHFNAHGATAVILKPLRTNTVDQLLHTHVISGLCN